MATKTSSAVKAKKTRNPPTHPRYIEMISEPIVTLKERNGSSQYAIAKHIEDKQKQLPSNFKKLLLVQLKKLVASGKLVKVKSSFKIPAAAARSKESKSVIPPAKKNKLPVNSKAVTTKPAAKPAPKSKVTVAKSEAKPKAASKAKPAVKPKAAAAKPKAAVKKARVVTAKTSTRTSRGSRGVAAASPALKSAPKKAPVKPKTVKSPEKKRVTRVRKN